MLDLHREKRGTRCLIVTYNRNMIAINEDRNGTEDYNSSNVSGLTGLRAISAAMIDSSFQSEFFGQSAVTVSPFQITDGLTLSVRDFSWCSDYYYTVAYFKVDD